MAGEPLVERMRGFGTTVFAEMTALATAHDAVNLGQGFPDSDGPPEMLSAAAAAITAGGLNQYPPGHGMPALREAVAADRARHGLRLDPDTDVLVTVGATEGVGAAILALCEAGDEVIVFEPYYDCYAAAIRLAGARRVTVALRPDASGHVGFDPGELRAAVTPRTRLVLVNSPHNPTGTVLDRAELETIAAVCRDHDLLAVTDEVYEHLVYDGEHVPLATLPGMAERTLSVSSAGKTFSVTGWKIGWVSGPASLVRAVSTVKQFLTFTHSAPTQLAVASALTGSGAWVEAQRQSLRRRRDLLAGGLDGLGLGVVCPQAGYFVVADIAPVAGPDADGAAWARALPAAAGVAAIPVSVFCDTPELARTLVRFAFCKQEPVIADALDRLGRHLSGG